MHEIVIIEDMRSESDLLQILLGGKAIFGQHIQCHPFTTIEQALQWIKAHPTAIVAVIIDRTLGDDNGLRIIPNLKHPTAPWGNLVIIVWSQHDDNHMIGEARQIGADAFVSKQYVTPRLGDEMIHIVETMLTHDRQEQNRPWICISRGGYASSSSSP
ncbi:MAG: response regulator [Blastochloris sp.]|nr:response regulator [Blastochloris sp.]